MIAVTGKEVLYLILDEPELDAFGLINARAAEDSSGAYDAAEAVVPAALTLLQGEGAIDLETASPGVLYKIDFYIDYGSSKGLVIIPLNQYKKPLKPGKMFRFIFDDGEYDGYTEIQDRNGQVRFWLNTLLRMAKERDTQKRKPVKKEKEPELPEYIGVTEDGRLYLDSLFISADAFLEFIDSKLKTLCDTGLENSFFRLPDGTIGIRLYWAPEKMYQDADMINGFIIALGDYSETVLFQSGQYDVFVETASIGSAQSISESCSDR